MKRLKFGVNILKSKFGQKDLADFADALPFDGVV